MKKILEAELKAVSGGVTPEESDALSDSINKNIQEQTEKEIKESLDSMTFPDLPAPNIEPGC